MPRFLDHYITAYDDSLSSDSYIDPVGTLIVWSAFGRQVFNNRVNSVSNDIRNYTLNLFNHFLIRRLEDDHGATLSSSLLRKYHSKESLHFKQACLVFLENLFVYSLLKHDRTEGVQTAGVLGISNARRHWDKAESNPSMVFTHEPSGQILVRQLGLGVSGRYRTPLIEIGFFDRNNQYNRPQAQPHWAAAERLFAGARQSPIARLERSAYKYLKQCVATVKHAGKLPFSEVPQELTKGYARAFASPRQVGDYAKDFWLSETGLDRGASGAILEVMESDVASDLGSRELVERALRQDLDPLESAKLEQITKLEPFLSEVSLLFTLMAAERTQSISVVSRHWTRFGRDANRLPRLADGIQGHADLPAVRGTAAARRLIQLREVAYSGDVANQVRGLAEYHRHVMRTRGQQPWLDIDSKDTIKVNSRTTPRPEESDRPLGSWSNEYYIPQFRNLADGMRGIGS